MPALRRPRPAATLLDSLPWMRVWLEAHACAPADLLEATADVAPDGTLQALALVVLLPTPTGPRRADILLDAPALAALRQIAASAIDTQAYISRIRAAAC